MSKLPADRLAAYSTRKAAGVRRGWREYWAPTPGRRWSAESIVGVCFVVIAAVVFMLTMNGPLGA